jgi:hypothetical protein
MLFAVRFAASSLALVLVAAYYLLASIPFAYYHFLQFPHFWWMPLFIRLHPLVLAAAVAGLLPRPRAVAPPLRPWIRYVAIAGGTTTACMAAIGFAPVLLSYEIAEALVFVPLALLTAASVITIAAAGTTADDSDWPGVAAIIRTGALAGLMIGVGYAAAGAERGAALALGRRELAVAVAVSIAAHTVCFAGAALAVAAVRAWSRRRTNRLVEWLAVAGCATAAGAVVVRRSLLTALILGDLRAALVAVTLALAIVSAIWAISRRTARPRAGGRRYSALPALATVVVSMTVLPRLLLFADWGGSLQKIVAVVAWSAAVTFVARASRAGQRRTAAGCVVVLVAASSAIAVHGASFAGRSAEPRLDVRLAVDRYGTFDASLAVLLDVFRPLVTDREFYETVRSVGDATDDRSLGAVPLTLADVARPPSTRPPNIFVVVVDSLRPDYLSAYNPAATFTPAIGAFAKESIVMRRAYTQYAGTALSQPALWAGGLIQRAMYVKPFAPIDNLERLTVAAGYRRYVSVDQILTTILEDQTRLTRLDTHLAHPERLEEMFKFDLCTTVPELTDQIDRGGMKEPVFFYTQPQNIHIRVLAGDTYPRDERISVGGGSFFKLPVAPIARVDGCFGRLIDFLKQRGVYDDSIVILTADHGDSYGEGGRWAHAYYMAPETLRIPLIMHVPQKYLQSRAVDPNRVALLSDVTPTLYDLLGYRPHDTADIAGRSLFPPLGEPIAPRDMVLVQSSYSRVYGLLDGDARWLYVADASHEREAFFDIEGGDVLGQSVNAADRRSFRKWLLDRMVRLNRFYRRPTIN